MLNSISPCVPEKERVRAPLNVRRAWDPKEAGSIPVLLEEPQPAIEIPSRIRAITQLVSRFSGLLSRIVKTWRELTGSTDKVERKGKIAM